MGIGIMSSKGQMNKMTGAWRLNTEEEQGENICTRGGSHC